MSLKDSAKGNRIPGQGGPSPGYRASSFVRNGYEFQSKQNAATTEYIRRSFETQTHRDSQRPERAFGRLAAKVFGFVLLGAAFASVSLWLIERRHERHMNAALAARLAADDTQASATGVATESAAAPTPSTPAPPSAWSLATFVDVASASAVVAGLKPGVGAIAYGIADGAPGDLENGDIILSVDGKPVHGAADLSKKIKSRRAGKVVSAVILRHGSRYASVIAAF